MTTSQKSTLYSLQDRVLKQLAEYQVHQSFYLTGGTCVARCYFHHRVSVDLDFFCHNEPEFLQKIESIISALKKQFHVKSLKSSPKYIAIQIDDLLKLDFVEDTGEHLGSTRSHEIFPVIDNLDNILANKITAIMSRDEPKDIADIWIICQNQKTDWQKVFTDVKSKAAGIIPPYIAERLESFPAEWISQIDWEMSPPTPEKFHNDLVKIADNILAA